MMSILPDTNMLIYVVNKAMRQSYNAIINIITMPITSQFIPISKQNTIKQEKNISLVLFLFNSVLF